MMLTHTMQGEARLQPGRSPLKRGIRHRGASATERNINQVNGEDS